MLRFVSIIVSASALDTTLQAVSHSELTFQLGDVNVQSVDEKGTFAVEIPGWPLLNEPGAPALPVVRASMLLPAGFDGNVELDVVNVESNTLPLSTWGKQVQHSQGKVCMCCKLNSTIPPKASIYQALYPLSHVTLEAVHTWRDVKGVVVEVQPWTVDHSNGVVHILKKCSIKLKGAPAPTVQPVTTVDPAFLNAYSFVYSNYEHYAERFVQADQNGRLLVVYESQFEAQANTYAQLATQRLGSEVLMHEADSSSSAIKSVITGHYNEPQKLSYVTIIGRNVPTPTGSQTQTECDNCYAMMSGGTSLDLFVGRISGARSSDIEGYLTKLRNYDSSSTAAWTKVAYGTAASVMGDENAAMTQIMQNLNGGGFSTSWSTDRQTSGSETAEKMNSGLGVFAYIGHGSGTSWNTPSFSVSQVQRLTNTDKPFFSIDVSCDNGGFREHSPSMGEALITASGGAIATMMSSPEMRGTMCKRYQEQSAKAIATGSASRVGPVYVTGLMKGQQLDRDDYTVQAYNVFGDPTLWLSFAQGNPPVPTPSPPSPPTPAPEPTPAPLPVPSPVPSPTPSGQCHAISEIVTDDWCTDNCALGFCPSDLCSCDSIMV